MSLKVYLYDSKSTLCRLCLWLLKRTDGIELVDIPKKADVAIAPELDRKLEKGQYAAPKYGTLIFHASLLPRHRGKDPIRWAFLFNERYSGATWFWADEQLDAGDLCEQEVLSIRLNEKPREFYHRAVVPAALRMLQYILQDLKQGIVRRRPQQEEHATFEIGLQISDYEEGI